MNEVDLDNVSELTDEPSLPEQHDFYKMPAKFGHVPVAEEPLGWDKQQRFEKLYPRVSLPTQVVERVEFGNPELEPNRLFFGDNLHVMRSLPSESIDLIYIDPPFFSQQTYNVLFGDQNELRSFKDIWEGGMNGYLVWLNARLYEMKRLLKPTGSLVVHLDWHASHYVKIELDKLFGYERFQNEIVWSYRGGGVSKRRFGRKHDILLWYSRGSEWHYDGDAVRVPYSKDSLERLKYTARSFRGDRVYSSYQPNEGGKLPEDVWEIQPVMPSSKKRIGYPTQKPEVLLDRVVKAMCPPGGLVADFFVGGGTTAAAAQESSMPRRRAPSPSRSGTRTGSSSTCRSLRPIR